MTHMPLDFRKFSKFLSASPSPSARTLRSVASDAFANPKQEHETKQEHVGRIRAEETKRHMLVFTKICRIVFADIS